MARGILVVGGSGEGKSTSGRNLDPKSTFWINVQGKELPFKHKEYIDCDPKDPSKGNLYYNDDAKTIKQLINFISDKRPEIEDIVIDDTQYCAVNKFMRKLDEKGFAKFNEIGHDIWSLPENLPRLRKNLNVYFLYHDEVFVDEIGNKTRRAKQMGKLIDQQVGGIEGYFTYVIFTEVKKENNKINHYFITNNEGNTTAKTPLGIFDEIRIPNDLQLVKEKINEYYN